MRSAGFAAAWLLLAAHAQAAAIDLHAHLFMDVALPGVFHGHPTREPARVSGRAARFVNQVSLKDLEAANVRLVAAALYAPAVLSQFKGGYHRTLLRQIKTVERWAAGDSRIAIVRSPEEAEAVLKSQEWRLGVIIAAEGTHGVESLERLDALWERGLRMLTLAHFVDSRWAGAAAVTYWPRSECVPGGKDPGRRNAKGLTAPGEKLVDRAVAKGLILDLTHSSDRTVSGVASRHPGLPLMFSHQAARELTPCERTISPELLREVRRSRGMVGITLASNYVGEDMASFLLHAAAIAREAGPDAVAIGSDYNGLIRRVEGAADSSGYAAALKGLEAAGIPALNSAEAFVGFWRRTLAYGARPRGG
ncbi:MAG: membrane dipeptidase [Elusimicrobia bacterium]|nr:membrane dipeptidase [Elusimicrobiota bacterium]